MLTKQLLASTFLLAMAACGDDGGVCVGHACGGGPQLSDPEGGNIIFEYIYFDSELQSIFGAATVNRVMAYFMNDVTPPDNPYPMPGVCNNLVATKGWPTYIPPAGMHLDLDVGSLTIHGKNTAGADVSITVPKKPMGTDAIGRPHDVYYQVINPKAEDFLLPDSSYSIEFGGSDVITPFTFKDAMFLAKGFTVTDLESNGPLVAGTDYTTSWNYQLSAALPAGDTELGAAWLVDTAGSPTHLCPTMASAGQFTIPGSAIAEYKQIAAARSLPTNKAILLRNTIVHKMITLPNNDAMNKRRVDCVSVHCWAQLVDVQ